jgi:hypothetical protein
MIFSKKVMPMKRSTKLYKKINADEALNAGGKDKAMKRLMPMKI